jgi:hypothetical protein
MEEYTKMFIEISFQQVRIRSLEKFIPNDMGGLERVQEATHSIYMKCVCKQYMRKTKCTKMDKVGVEEGTN